MKVNNGYLALIHYNTSETRCFGPFGSPYKAFNTLKTSWKLDVAIPKREIDKAKGAGRDFKPVIGRKYLVLNKGISSLEISVLEIHNLLS